MDGKFDQREIRGELRIAYHGKIMKIQCISVKIRGDKGGMSRTVAQQHPII
jgi:hypothetical protein